MRLLGVTRRKYPTGGTFFAAAKSKCRFEETNNRIPSRMAGNSILLNTPWFIGLAIIT
jgi:hypothetical protein